jgi:hypothetical protein
MHTMFIKEQEGKYCLFQSNHVLVLLQRPIDFLCPVGSDSRQFLPRVDLNTTVRGERVHSLHPKRVKVTSVFKGYVGNGLCVCLVPYQMLSIYSSSKETKQYISNVFVSSFPI